MSFRGCNNHVTQVANNLTEHVSSPTNTFLFTYIYTVIYVVGLFGNIIALMIWTRSRILSSPVTYFQAICVADSLVLVLHPMEKIHAVHVIGICQFLHILFLAVQVLAILLVLCLSVERYIELCHPLSAERIISHKRTVRTIILLTLLSVIFSLFEAYIWSVEPKTDLLQNQTSFYSSSNLHNTSTIKYQCQIRQTISHNWLWAYGFVVLGFLFIFPLIIVIIMNILVAYRIKSRRRKNFAFSVAMVPDKHNMNISVAVLSLYLAIFEMLYAIVHISQYFSANVHESLKNNFHLNHDQSCSLSSQFDAPMTGRWRSYYVNSFPLMIMDAIALTSYAVDLTVFTLCSRTFRKIAKELFLRFKKRVAEKQKITKQHSIAQNKY